MPSTIHSPELRTLLENHDDVRILDVRTPGEFDSAHIPGSYNIPLDALPTAIDELRSVTDRVVVVCQSGARASKACVAMQESGIESVELLTGGIAAWEQSGGTVRRGRPRWALERQVRLVAGSLVTLFVLASFAFPPLAIGALLVGAGLTFAALTNTCAMGALLSKLPYNRVDTADPSDVARQLAGGRA